MRRMYAGTVFVMAGFAFGGCTAIEDVFMPSGGGNNNSYGWNAQDTHVVNQSIRHSRQQHAEHQRRQRAEQRNAEYASRRQTNANQPQANNQYPPANTQPTTDRRNERLEARRARAT